MKTILGGRAVMLLVTVIVTASLTVLWGPNRSSIPVLASGADKIAISAATDTLINQNQQANASSASTVQLASTSFSTSTTEDLVVNFSTECGLYTAVGGKNNNTTTTTLPVTTSSTALGQVMVWLQLDGRVLPVSANAGAGGPGNGLVSYCSRALNLSTANLSPQQLIQISENTLDANSFQWFALNVGNGTHTLKVYASLIANTQSSGTNGGSGSCDASTDPTCFYTTPAASALVTQRTLEVYPDHLAPSANF
jgi:hypothetical protein